MGGVTSKTAMAVKKILSIFSTVKNNLYQECDDYFMINFLL